jgi:hypothetical protein
VPGIPVPDASDPPTDEIDTMTKILSALILTAFAFGAQAASHAGGAPMKDKAASAPAAAASGAKKADKAEKKAEKKEEAKK